MATGPLKKIHLNIPVLWLKRRARLGPKPETLKPSTLGVPSVRSQFWGLMLLKEEEMLHHFPYNIP